VEAHVFESRGLGLLVAQKMRKLRLFISLTLEQQEWIFFQEHNSWKKKTRVQYRTNDIALNCS
jgi:hypothetical protein